MKFLELTLHGHTILLCANFHIPLPAFERFGNLENHIKERSVVILAIRICSIFDFVAVMEILPNLSSTYFLPLLGCFYILFTFISYLNAVDEATESSSTSASTESQQPQPNTISPTGRETVETRSTVASKAAASQQQMEAISQLSNLPSEHDVAHAISNDQVGAQVCGWKP